MTSLLLLLALAAPKAPLDAELVTYVPRLEAVASTVPFFRAAGTRALLLRPEAWRTEAEPLLELDLTSRDSLALAGVDAAGSLTTSRLGERTVTCFSLSDPTLFTARVTARLARLGTVFTRVENGATVTGARDPIDRVLAAVATSGREACTLVGHGLSVEKQLPLLVKTLAKPLVAPGVAMALSLPGAVSFLVPQGAQPGALTLSAKELTLTADAKAKGLPLIATAGAGASPYGALAADGLLVVRARFLQSAMPQALTQLLARLPWGGALAGPAKTLGPLLTGNAALVVSHVKVTSGLRTPLARLFAVRFALLAEVSDTMQAQALVNGLDPHVLASREGQLDVVLERETVVVSNDAEVKERVRRALEGARGKQTHGVEFVAKPTQVARGLAQVPLVEALQAPELAGLVAVSAELGPLLLASERLAGWVEVGPTQRAQLTWSLSPSKFIDVAADAGADAGAQQ